MLIGMREEVEAHWLRSVCYEARNIETVILLIIVGDTAIL